MNYDKKKSIVLIAVLSLIIILTAVYLFHILQKQVPVGQSTGLTPDQRAQILKELSSGKKVVPLTKTERKAELKNLGAGTKVKTLTEKEKTNILKSLQ